MKADTRGVRGVQAKVVVAREYGDAASVLSLDTRTLPPPGPGEALVRMVFSPIHASDLNIIEGNYIRQPPPPFIPGREGVGEVVDVGEGCPLAAGDRIMMPFQEPASPSGWWASHRIVHANEVTVLPASVSSETGALLTINPPTALLLVREHLERAPDGWLIQNAGTSDVGRAVVQIAKAMGVRTFTIASTPRGREILEACGADVVLAPTDDIERRATAEGAKLRTALDGLGDASTIAMARALAPEGVVVTYGGMARAPLRIPISLLIYRGIRFTGFMRTRWIDHHGLDAYKAALDEIVALAAKNALRASIDSVYPLHRLHDALARSQERGRAGKVLLSP